MSSFGWLRSRECGIDASNNVFYVEGLRVEVAVDRGAPSDFEEVDDWGERVSRRAKDVASTLVYFILTSGGLSDPTGLRRSACSLNHFLLRASAPLSDRRWVTITSYQFILWCFHLQMRI